MQFDAEYKAMLAPILANPTDDTARLIFADWLEEKRGEGEWADFIRRSIAGVTGESFNMPAPWGPDRVMFGTIYSRGFLSYVILTWEQWLAEHQRWREWYPIERVKLTTRPQQISFLFESLQINQRGMVTWGVSPIPGEYTMLQNGGTIQSARLDELPPIEIEGIILPISAEWYLQQYWPCIEFELPEPLTYEPIEMPGPPPFRNHEEMFNDTLNEMIRSFGIPAHILRGETKTGDES